MSKNERGAAAVEFALVVPLLVALLAGIAEFGHAYYLQATLSGSAREGVRVMALRNDPGAARTAAKNAAAPLTLGDAQIVVAPGTAGGCTPGANATVTITYSMAYLSGMFGSTVNLSGKGVMRCGG